MDGERRVRLDARATPSTRCAIPGADLVHPQDAPGAQRLVPGHRRRQARRRQVESASRHREGHNVWTGLTISLIRNAIGAPVYTVAMIEDITPRHELEERLRQQALHDPLTLLPNRTLFTEQLRRRLRPAGSGSDLLPRPGPLQGGQRPARAPDRGHPAGRGGQAARRERERSRASGGRMGGDEFVILVRTRPGELALLAEACWRR